MAAPRQLAYKDRFVWHLEQVVSAIFDDCDDFTDRYVFPDMDTRVPLVILLSQREWTTLYSAVLTGADLTYPDTSHNVELLFLQTVICSMNEFCAAMINCLENDPDVLAALQALLSDNGLTGGVGDPNQPLDPTILAGNLLPPGYTCTDDKAFGMALAVVESINDATTEVLQAIEILTNPLEIANELGDNVPGLGALTSAGDMAAWVQNSAQEAYELAWSTVVRDELACLIWCEFKFSCELNLDMIWDIYLASASVTPPVSQELNDWVVWLIGLPLPGALGTVARVSLLGLLAIRYGGSFGEFSLGIQSMRTVMELAENDTSSAWSTVCDPCGFAWCYNALNGEVANWTPTISDFPCGECDIGISTSELTGCLVCVNSSYLIETGFPLAAGTVWDQIEIDIEWNITRGGTSNFAIAVDEVTIHIETITGTGSKTVTLGADSGDVRFFNWLQASATNEASGAYANITGLRFYGWPGTPNAFGVDDC